MYLNRELASTTITNHRAFLENVVQDSILVDNEQINIQILNISLMTKLFDHRVQKQLLFPTFDFPQDRNKFRLLHA